MWPFNRSKKTIDTKAPKEVQQYYASEHRERVGLAWLIAFASLVITVAVMVGLFFGGRWAYRKIAHNNPTVAKPQTISQPVKPSTKPSISTPTPTKPTQPSSGNTPQSSSTSTQTPSQPVASAPAQTSTPAQTPSTSQAPSKNITNTGPGETIAIFIAVSLLGALAHSAYLRRRTLA